MKLILKISFCLIFIFFLQNILFGFFPNLSTNPAIKIDSALTNKADVIIFGDSVMVDSSYKDSDRRPIYLMLQDKIPKINLKAIDDLGYTSEVYLEQVKYIAKNRFKPKVAIIPINLRSFSPQWDQKPAYQFEIDKLTLRYKNTPIFPFVKFLINFNLFNLVPVSQTQYLNAPVYSEDILIGTIKDFENPEYDNYTEEHLKNKILLSYTYTLSKNHRKLIALEEIADLLTKNNIKAIFYVTPIDYEANEKHTGSYANNQISKNINLIKYSLNKYPVVFLDLSFKLSSGNFSWENPQYINEHLNQNGRQFVADELATITNTLIYPQF